MRQIFKHKTLSIIIGFLFLISMTIAMNNGKIEVFKIDKKTEYAVNQDVLDKHVIKTVNPSNVTINLFDYWVENIDETTPNDNYNIGINENHALLFKSYGYDRNPQPKNYNMYTGGNNPFQGIVSRTLENGFPKLNNIDTGGYNWWGQPDSVESGRNGNESLAYLFDPNTPNPYRKDYLNVKNLFRFDASGNYIYDSTKNFAKFDEETNSFIVYDAPGGGAEGGEFFPFNDPKPLFNEVNGKLQMINQNVDNMKHYYGMHFSSTFLQPVGGQVNLGANGNAPMVFNFSGDDDCWIFIDGVLVADAGGIHSRTDAKINFQTGAVQVTGMQNTTIYNQFVQAGATSRTTFTGNTFATNTIHTIDVFYLERGAGNSNLTLDFNAEVIHYAELKKVDIDGNPIKGAVFDLYEAKGYTPSGNPADITFEEVKNYVKPENKITNLTTDENGYANFIEPGTTLEPLSFYNRYLEGTSIYILVEQDVPGGYKKLSEGIVLAYDEKTDTLVTNSVWTTGVDPSFSLYVTGNDQISYGKYNETNNSFEYDNNNKVTENTQKNGIVVAVPIIQQENGKYGALYGSEIEGYHVVEFDNKTSNFTESILAAFLHQVSSNERDDWYLSYDISKLQLTGHLRDLPGVATRYQLYNPDGDLDIVYAVIEPNILTQLGIAGQDTEERIASLLSYIKGKENGGMTEEEAVWDTVRTIDGFTGGANGSGFNILNVGSFSREFKSLIYVPNDRRELRVRKTSEDGEYVNGAKFSLFKTYADAEQNVNAIATGTTGTYDGNQGLLIFSPIGSANGTGLSYMNWNDSDVGTKFYLKETGVPTGFKINNEIVTIVVGTNSIYADAGEKDDGVVVRATVGRLMATMNKYASDSTVNTTLRDIISYKQTQNSANFDLNTWNDTEETQELHYGLNAIITYGLHGDDSEPYFESDVGFTRVQIKQNFGIHSDPSDKYYTNTNKNNLEDLNISNIFNLVNTIVITDEYDSNLQVGKEVTGMGITNEDFSKEFKIKITLENSNGQPVNGTFKGVKGAESGSTTNGEIIITLKSGQSIVFNYLPEGTKYTIEELAESQEGYTASYSNKTGTVTEEMTVAKVINKKDIIISNTGGVGTKIYKIIGAILLILSIVLFQKKRGIKYE